MVVPEENAWTQAIRSFQDSLLHLLLSAPSILLQAGFPCSSHGRTDCQYSPILTSDSQTIEEEPDSTLSPRL